MDKKIGFEVVLGEYTYDQKNDKSFDILEFIQTFDLILATSIFAKPTDELVTFKSAESKSQIDVFLTRREHNSKIKDCFIKLM